MAVVKPTIKGYPVCEGNILQSRISGRIWSQYELNSSTTDTLGFGSGNKAYNGMILAVDDKNKQISLPQNGASATTSDEIYGLVFSSEAEYEHKGLNTFALAREPIEGEPNVSVHYPRVFRLHEGDVFHTNCVQLDGTNIDSLTTLATDLAEGSTTAVYGGVCSDKSGFIEVNTTKPVNGPVLEAVEYSTIPNGDWGIKFVVRKA